MNTEIVREYLIDFQKNELPELVEREMSIAQSPKIKSIIGPRRAGKTYFLYQTISRFIKSGIKKENILYLNFEDPRLVEINFKEIREVIKLHWQLYPESIKNKLFLFIDEPQNIKNWEIAVRALYDEGLNIFLTGSSSKLLSKEIATSLRGRTISYTLLPFSFKEFLKIKDYEVPKRISSREMSLLFNLFNEYIEFGGFPEIILEKSTENKVKIIDEYFNLIVYRDVVERYKIKNTNLIKWLIKSITASFAKEFSVHKLYLTLKSRGIKVSKNTLYSYLSMLEDSLFVFFVPKFSYSIRKKELTINKAYLCDIFFTKLTEVSEDKGRKMENIVFLELERRKKPFTNIFYWRNSQQEEVDLIIAEKKKVREIIQVCANIDNIDTKKRELRSLLKASKELKCKNLLVITENKEGTETIVKNKIRYIPLWKWLLE